MFRGVLIVLALLATACGGSSKPATSGSRLAPTSSLPASPTTSEDLHAKDKAEITAVYKSWNRLVSTYYERVDRWDEEDAKSHAGGVFLARSRFNIAKWEASGTRSHQPSDSRARTAVTEIDVNGNHASMQTCEVNDSIVETVDGVVLDDRVGTYLTTWTLTKTDQGWRLWQIDSSELIEGVHPCDA